MSNREHLFRGFCPDESGERTIYIDGKEIRGRWVYGMPLTDKVPCGAKEDGKCSCPHDGTHALMIYWDDECHEYDYVDVIPETVGEWTGLEDQEGNRIFEDDIVCVNYNDGGQADDCITKIQYDISTCSYLPFNWKCICDDCEWSFEIYDITIIGNVWENPELLEV